MKVEVPSLEQFSVQAVDEVRFSGTNEEIKYSVEITAQSITNRVVVALMDQTQQKGMAIAIYPATGEVCDVTNGGGVIGYLKDAPLSPNKAISCELSIYRFGKNFVCNAVIDGETFLYPAFSCDGNAPMAALVGKECHNGDSRLNWNRLNIEMQELSGVVIAA